MLRKSTLPADVRELLLGLLAKDQSQLSQDEIAFIRARQDYLSKHELEDVSELIGVDVKKTEEAEIVKPKLKRRFI